jgi:tetratricopeptide (TPR) repeat protein
MNIIEQQFFRGNMRACFQLAKKYKDENFIELFQQHHFEQLPIIPDSIIAQSKEQSDEHYAEEQLVIEIREIKEEVLFQQAVKKLEEDAKSEHNSYRAHSYFTQGYLFLYAHHYDEAAFCFRQAVHFAPENAVYAGICGQTLQRLNESPFEALAYLEHAITLQADNARWYWCKTLILLQFYKDLEQEEFLNSAIFDIQQALHVCRDDQVSLRAAIQLTEQEIGQIIAMQQ